MYIRLLMFFFLITTVVFSQKTTLSEEVRASIESRIAYGINPSIVVGVIDKNGPRYYSFGSKSMGGDPANEHTIYEIGSISKVFTGTMLADNIVKGKMKADDPISKYLPSTVIVPTYEGQPITLGNLSDHTSSLPRMPSNFSPANPDNPYADYTVDQLYAFLSGCELTRPVGSEYEYSNLAVGLLGNILASNAGTTFEALLTKMITTPLKMTETSITLSEKMKANLATGYSMGVEIPNWDLPTLAGAGAIRSSVHNMLLFLSANMGLSKSDLKKAMELAQTPRHDKAGGTSVGLGWHIASGKDGEVIFHNGATGGYTGFTGFVKETGIGVVVLTNSSHSVDDIGFHLLDANSNLESIYPSLALALRQIIDSEGAKELIEKYNGLKEKGPDTYNANENDINALGYYYMSKNQVDAALAIFEINVKEFPESFNVYDSYGEALMKNGQKEEAIVNYKKSLELKPGNINAVEMLAQMGEKVKMTEIEVAESILQSYVGIYELVPGFNLEISRNTQQLFCQATGQSKFELFAASETDFYLKVLDAQIVFSTSADGIISLTLFQSGQAMPGRRIK